MIAHDATTPAVNSANSTGESFAHTCSGSDLTLVAIVLLFGTVSNGVSAITYNGVSMGTAKATRENNYTVNRYLTALIFTLDSPATGSNTCSVTFSGTAVANAIILTSYTGANNGVGANNGGADGTDDTPTTSFDTDTSGGLIVAGASVLGADTDPFTPGAGVTERSDGDTGGGSANTDIGFTTGDKVATGGTDAIAFTAAAADFWTIVAVELNEAAGGGGTDALTPSDLATGTPTLTAAAIGQVHAISATDLVTASPTLTSAALGQTHALSADDLTASAPVLDSPALGQVHALTPNDLTVGTPELDSSSLGQVHALTPSDLAAGSPVLDSPALGTEGTDALTANDLATGQPVLSSPALGQIHALVPDYITTGTPLLDTAVLGQVHVLSGDDLMTGVPTLGAPEVADSGLVLAIYTVSLLANPSPVLSVNCNALPNQNILTNGTPAASLSTNATPAVSLRSNPTPAQEVEIG